MTYWRLCLLVLLSGLTLGCTPASTPNQLEQVRERGVLRVGTTISPTTYYLHQEQPAGLEYALAQRFADQLGVSLQMVPRYNLKHLFSLLDSGEVDFIAAGIDRTEQRNALYRFTPPYQEIVQQVVYRQGSRPRPRELAELDAELVVVAGSSHAEWLQSQQPQYPELPWRAGDGNVR